MKKVILITFLAAICGAPLFAQEIVQQAPPSCEWYRAHEWNLNLWGTFAFTPNTGDNGDDLNGSGVLFPAGLGLNSPGGCGTACGQQNFKGERIAVESFRDDRLFGRDDLFGGGADVKFFFSKYWGLGVEGLILDTERNIAGGGFGTFTFRFPIGCSRFAPYAWAGGGVIAGGDRSEIFFNETFRGVGGGVTVRNRFNSVEGVENKHAEAAGQFGTGLEFRVTPRIGLMGDFAWVVVSGPENNFGMTRFGVTLSY